MKLMAGPMYSRFQRAPSASRSRRRQAREPSTVDMSKNRSSRSRDAWIIVNAPQGDAAVMPSERFAGPQMLGKDIPHRHSPLFVDRRPSRHLVILAGIERMAAVELQLGDPPANRFSRRAGVDKTADADHVAALLVIGIGIEEIVADVFEDILDLAAGHARDIGFRVGDGGLAQHVFHRHRLARQYA